MGIFLCIALSATVQARLKPRNNLPQMSANHPFDQTTVSPDAKHQTVSLYEAAEQDRYKAVGSLTSMLAKSQKLSEYHAQWNSDDVLPLYQLSYALYPLIGALHCRQRRFKLAPLHHYCRQMINAYHACGSLLSNLLIGTKPGKIHEIIDEMATALSNSEGPLYEWMSWLSSSLGRASNSLLQRTEDEASAHQSVEEAAYIPVPGQPYAIFLGQTQPHGIQPSSVVYSIGPSRNMFPHDPYSVISGPGTGSLPFSAYPTYPFPSHHSQLASNDPQLYRAAPPTETTLSVSHRVPPSWGSPDQILPFVPGGSIGAPLKDEGVPDRSTSLLKSAVGATAFQVGAALHLTGLQPVDGGAHYRPRAVPHASSIPAPFSSTYETGPQNADWTSLDISAANLVRVTEIYGSPRRTIIKPDDANSLLDLNDIPTFERFLALSGGNSGTDM